MHDSSSMPFVHVGLVVALLLVLAVALVTKQRRARKTRKQDRDV